MQQPQSAKILLFNLGYCTGLDGSVRDYVLHFLRYLHAPKRVLQRVVRTVQHLIEKEDPDLCCFTEVRRSTGFFQKFPSYSLSDSANKYGLHSLLRLLPVFRKNCGGFLSKYDAQYIRHYFEHGTKKLVYEIQLTGDVSVFFGHFSLNKSTREKQFAEMRDLIKQRKRVILCGDFNTFDGPRELHELMHTCGLKLVNAASDLTFPANHPRKAIDLFLCSRDLPIVNLEVIDLEHTSDHLPVILEVQLSSHSSENTSSSATIERKRLHS